MASSVKKPAAPQDPVLNIGNEMRQFDLKNRNFFDELTEEQKKKFSPYLMIRWGSSVQGSEDLQNYYLMSTNDCLNINFFDVNTTKHKKLQWLLATTVSPGLDILKLSGGVPRHQWIAPKKTDRDNKTMRFLAEQFPHLKNDELKLLATVNDKDDIRNLARELGWDEKRIKSDL